MNKKKQVIDRFEIIKSLAKGGMGEVFLAKDLTCGRIVALKKIRDDLVKKEAIRKRFLREAHLTARLTHPSIIPIYSIHSVGNSIYYSMPYVEGETLREVLRDTRQCESKGKTHPIGSSIPTLMNIFLKVCEAIAYAHSKGIIHRDIKPENIIIGKYGEVLILDWGLIDSTDPAKTESETSLDMSPLTKPGKVAGTLAFLAPERALGKRSTVLCDIYSLGGMLYQLLTLKLPFYRTSLPKFRKLMKHERLLELSEVAPYRDIPEHLAHIAKKCLQFHPSKRFQSVQTILKALKHYVEGHFEWIESSKLHLANKADWEFQENILLSKHIAITKEIDVMEWVYLMVSQESFTGNTKISTRVRLNNGGSGVGLLLSVPEAKERKNLEEGYSLWIGNAKQKCCKLFRNNVEVLETPDVFLKKDKWHTVSVEKIENNLYFYLDGALKFQYLSHLPLTGTHIGLLFRDTHFEMEAITVSIASHNATVNCLKVPDAFFSTKNYAQALAEYRKIGTSFIGRTEGREALFRAGITLLEKGKTKRTKKGREACFSAALEEFGKLHGTPAGPLEYFGKALVYRAMNDIEEEVKCLELSMRKFPKHPLLPPIEEEIIFRLHETSGNDRKGAYLFALLSLRFIPHFFERKDHKQLITHLTDHWEPLPFIEKSPQDRLIALAFWLAKPLTLLEIAHSRKTTLQDRKNAYYSIAQLGCAHILPKGNQALLTSRTPLPKRVKEVIATQKPTQAKCALYSLFRSGIDANKSKELLPLFAEIKRPSTPIKLLKAEALLLENRTKEAEKLFKNLPVDDTSPFFIHYGAYLAATEGKQAALNHFRSHESATGAPTLTSLLPLYLKKKLKFNRLFLWEQIELLRQLVLFSHCACAKKDVKLYRQRLKKALAHAQAQT